jgi:signal transduction histidine kinase/ligand-binding sensor domain-containing protein
LVVQGKKKGAARARLVLLLLALAFGIATIFPQEARRRYQMESWQIDEGLPQNSVTSMAQTRDGYLWLATFNGLVRFDGVRFTVYNSHNTPAIDTSRIVKVWEDRSGVLWVGTESGGIIRREGDSFHRLQLPKATQANSFCDGDEPGEVWIAAVDGRLLRYIGGAVENSREAWGLDSVMAVSVFREKSGRLNLYTNRGMYCRNGNKFAPVSAESARYPNNGDVVARARGGGWWRTIDSRISRFDNDRLVRELASASDFPAPASVLYEDRAGALWVGTAGAGAARIQPDGSRITIGEAYGLGHAHVRSILEDTEGNIWLGTDGAGLHRLRRGPFSVLNKAEGLGAEVALAIAEDDDGVWIGTNGGGLTRLGADGAESFMSPGNLPIVHVWNLLRDRSGTLWIGTWGGGVFRRRNGQFEAMPQIAFPNGVVLASCEDARGVIWFGGQDGLIAWDNGEARRHTVADGLSNNDVRAILDDGEGGLWIATNGGGLNHFKDGHFTAIRRGQGLADNAVWSLCRDSENTLWIGTFGGGLSMLHDGRLSSFTTDDGLPSDVICSITEVGDQLWISSYKGVFRIRKAELQNFARGRGQKLECSVYTSSDGLPSRECTGGFQPAACKTRDGRLFFPTVKGIAMIDPAALAPSSQQLPVIIEEAEFNGATMVVDTSATLQIPAGQEQIQFRYTGLNFSSPEKVKFRYKLTGLDTDWQDAGPRRTAYYSHLPPGDYQFHVIASNNDGVWNREGSLLNIHVAPAFYQTWWFLALCFLSTGGALTGVTRLVVRRRLQRRMELLEQQHALETERSRIARDIHDDLGASLIQITLLSELARTDLARPAEAEAHLRQISGTARDLTRAMDEIVWAINPQNDSLEDLLTYTVKFAQEHLRIARIRCRVDAPAHLPPLHLSADLRHNLFLAIKEAINNVAKHSQASEAWLRLRARRKEFTFEIEDNGVGLPVAALNGATEKLTTPGSHNGLRNMERRLREIGGTFHARPRPNGGAILRFAIPITAAERTAPPAPDEPMA